MTVADLRALLATYDSNMDVQVQTDDSYETVDGVMIVDTNVPRAGKPTIQFLVLTSKTED